MSERELESKESCEKFVELFLETEDAETEYQSVTVERTKNEEETKVLINYLFRTSNPETRKHEEDEISNLKLCFLQLQEDLFETLQRVGQDVSEWDTRELAGDPAATLELVKVAMSKLREGNEQTPISPIGEHSGKRTYADHLKHLNSVLRQYYPDTDDTSTKEEEAEQKPDKELAKDMQEVQKLWDAVEPGDEPAYLPSGETPKKELEERGKAEEEEYAVEPSNESAYPPSGETPKKELKEGGKLGDEELKVTIQQVQEPSCARKMGAELSKLKRVLREMSVVLEDTGEEETIPEEEVEDQLESKGAKKREELRCVQDQRVRGQEEREKEQEMKTQTEALQMEMQALKRHIEHQQGKLAEMQEDAKKCRELNEDLNKVRSANEELQRQDEEEKREEGRLAEETELIPQRGKDLLKEMQAVQKELEEREKAEEEELKATIQQVEQMRTTMEGKKTETERVKGEILLAQAELKNLEMQEVDQETQTSFNMNQLDVLKRIVNEGGKVLPELALQELMAAQARKAAANKKYQRVEEILLGEDGIEEGSHLCCLSPEFVPHMREVEEEVRRGGMGRLAEVTQQLDDSLKNTPTNVKIRFATVAPKQEKEVRDRVAAANEGMHELVQTLEKQEGAALEEQVKEVADWIEKVAQELGVSTVKNE